MSRKRRRKKSAPERSMPSDPQEGILEPPDRVETTLPQVRAQQAALAVVREYVESERIRNRRILVWMSSVFLFVVALILTVFVAVAVAVVARSRHASDMVRRLQDRAVAWGSELVSVTNELQAVRSGNREVQTALQEAELDRMGDERRLKTDLKRFSRWVDERNAQDREAITALEARLAQMEAVAEARARELSEMREAYAALQSRAAVSGAPPTQAGPASATVSTDVAAKDDAAIVPEGHLEASPASDPAAARTASSTVSGSPSGPDADAAPPAAAVASGVSVMTLSNGDRYEGQFKDGLFHGWGVYSYANGDRYEGEFFEDRKHGRGTLVFANGDRYEGQFRNDMMNGEGTLIYRNGNRYVGTFLDGLRHGSGVLSFQNGDVYRGEFVRDRRTGRGVYEFASGASYTGDFVDGRRHGRGEYTYLGGDKYVGQFRNGSKHGEGECVYANGSRMRGIWQQDILIKTLD